MIDKSSMEALTQYWSDTAKKDRLYTAIRTNDTAETERLRAEGVTLSDYIKAMLKKGGGSLVNPNEYGMDWYDFSYGVANYSPEEFISVIRNLYAELGEPIYFSDTVGSCIHDFYREDVFKCVIECFDNKRITKKWTLRGLVDRNKAELLGLVVEHGWLKLAKQRDELIKYSQQKGSTECTAFLLELKNRTTDTAAERAKAEKKLERELNAAPDSVTALKALWKYKKRGDGTLVITGYKGGHTVISVPERIGKSTVTAIGESAFSPAARAITLEAAAFRKTITRVTLPETITEIGGNAFRDCAGLEYVNIPRSVTRIGSGAFWGCTRLCETEIPDGVSEICFETYRHCFGLNSAVIPESVRKIGDYAFNDCRDLEKVTLPSGLTEIGYAAFGGCSYLKEVELPAGLTEISAACFQSCDFKRIVIPHGVTVISEFAFSSCRNLARIEIPDTVKKIGRSAFEYCAAETVVVPEGVTEIGCWAFAQSANLKRVELPRSLAKAVNYTSKGEKPETIFNDSPNVTAVVYPKSYAERYCKRNNIQFVYYDNL